MNIPSATEAVLAQYDKGKTKPTEILAALRTSIPTLTLATINRIIRDFRLRKNNNSKPKENVEKPKTPIQIISSEIGLKCATCAYHITGEPCVLPWATCPYEDELKVKLSKLEELRKIEAEKENQPKPKQDKKQGGAKKNYRSAPYRNDFDELEQEIDAMNLSDDEEAGNECQPDDIIRSTHIAGAFFNDINNPNLSDSEENMFLEDFGDILSPDIN